MGGHFCLQTFWELFCSVHVWKYFRKGGGLPYSKLVKEFFCLGLDFFFRNWGGGYLLPKILKKFSSVLGCFLGRGRGVLPDSKDNEELLLLWLRQCGRITKIQTL